jgi:PAS domain S-box-containing protein
MLFQRFRTLKLGPKLYVIAVFTSLIQKVSKVALQKEVAERDRAETGWHMAQDNGEHWVQERIAELSRTNERLQAEIVERKQAEERLAEERNLLQTVIADSRFIFNNSAHVKGLGATSQNELAGKTDLDIFPQELAKLYYEDEQNVIRSGQPLINREEPYVDPEGNKKWLLTVKAPVRDRCGQVVALVGMSRDITDSKRAQEKLKRYAKELEQSNRELQEFAYVASHDLQEPLRKVQVFSSRLQAKYSEALDDRGQDYLARMQNAVARMQNLINGLLTYSRVTTQAQPFVSVDLAQVVQEILSDLEIHIQQVGGRVEAGDLPTLEADPIQMRQLLQNLISNSLKFHRPEEAPNIKIQATALNGQDRHSPGDAGAVDFQKIMVMDNGIGFDDKQGERIFQVFQRLHGRSEYEGTGIGLATCRKIVERHGGTISAQSVQGQGTTFIIMLPAKQTVEGQES